MASLSTLIWPISRNKMIFLSKRTCLHYGEAFIFSNSHLLCGTGNWHSLHRNVINKENPRAVIAVINYSRSRSRADWTLGQVKSCLGDGWLWRVWGKWPGPRVCRSDLIKHSHTWQLGKAPITLSWSCWNWCRSDVRREVWVSQLQDDRNRIRSRLVADRAHRPILLDYAQRLDCSNPQENVFSLKSLYFENTPAF